MPTAVFNTKKTPNLDDYAVLSDDEMTLEKRTASRLEKDWRTDRKDKFRSGIFDEVLARQLRQIPMLADCDNNLSHEVHSNVSPRRCILQKLVDSEFRLDEVLRHVDRLHECRDWMNANSHFWVESKICEILNAQQAKKDSSDWLRIGRGLNNIDWSFRDDLEVILLEEEQWTGLAYIWNQKKPRQGSLSALCNQLAGAIKLSDLSLGLHPLALLLRIVGSERERIFTRDAMIKLLRQIASVLYKRSSVPREEVDSIDAVCIDGVCLLLPHVTDEEIIDAEFIKTIALSLIENSCDREQTIELIRVLICIAERPQLATDVIKILTKPKVITILAKHLSNGGAECYYALKLLYTAKVLVEVCMLDSLLRNLEDFTVCVAFYPDAPLMIHSLYNHRACTQNFSSSILLKDESNRSFALSKARIITVLADLSNHRLEPQLFIPLVQLLSNEASWQEILGRLAFQSFGFRIPIIHQISERRKQDEGLLRKAILERQIKRQEMEFSQNLARLSLELRDAENKLVQERAAADLHIQRLIKDNAEQIELIQRDMQAEINRLNQLLSRLQLEIMQAREELDGRNLQLEKMKNDLEQKDHDRANLQHQLKEAQLRLAKTLQEDKELRITLNRQLQELENLRHEHQQLVVSEASVKIRAAELETKLAIRNDLQARDISSKPIAENENDTCFTLSDTVLREMITEHFGKSSNDANVFYNNNLGE